MVPLVKTKYPDFDGKTRQTLIRGAWKKLKDEFKFSYVQMSRADRERALYVNKLTQIKEEMIAHSGSKSQTTTFGNPFAQGLQDIEARIASELEKSQMQSESEMSPSDDDKPI